MPVYPGAFTRSSTGCSRRSRSVPQRCGAPAPDPATERWSSKPSPGRATTDPGRARAEQNSTPRTLRGARSADSQRSRGEVGRPNPRPCRPCRHQLPPTADCPTSVTATPRPARTQPAYSMSPAFARSRVLRRVPNSRETSAAVRARGSRRGVRSRSRDRTYVGVDEVVTLYAARNHH